MDNHEEWTPVIGYYGLYEVSTNGRVKSLCRTTTRGKILKQYINSRNGYCYVSLSKNNERRSARVHKLVYEAFTGDIQNGYDSKRTINHLDGNKQNNSLGNLERCTQSENQLHCHKHKLQKISGIKVVRLSDKRIFDTLTLAARAVGGNTGEMVARVCRGERSHYRNVRFAFYEDYINGTIPEYKGKNKRKASDSLWR